MSKETENILRFAGLIAVFLLIMAVALGRIRKLEKQIYELEHAPADTSSTKNIDTMNIDNPQLIAKYESDKEKVAIEMRRLKKQLAAALNKPADTLEIHDTTTQLVYLPREYMVYKDTNYRAVVSGVQPRLDSMEVYRTTITNTITKYVEVKKKNKWGIGVQAGYGYNGKKFSPYAGVGVQYNIVSW